MRQERLGGSPILMRNPEFNRINARLVDGNVGSDERVQLITDIEALHTFSGSLSPN